jgi:hypothetical protein
LVSGENATEETEMVWALNDPETTSPISASHILIKRLYKPNMMDFLSGENMTELKI